MRRAGACHDATSVQRHDEAILAKKQTLNSLIGSGAYPTAPAGEGGGWSRSRLSVLKWDPFPEMGP
jgi:hypothetical protein